MKSERQTLTISVPSAQVAEIEQAADGIPGGRSKVYEAGARLVLEAMATRGPEALYATLCGSTVITNRRGKTAKGEP